MNTREQLEELDKYFTTARVDAGVGYITGNLTLEQAQGMVKQLIAERPYEPGDQILVRLPASRAREWHQASFVAMHHGDSGYVWASINGGPAYVYDHKPLPKTYRVKPVPVEVIDDAKEARKAFGLVAHGNQSEVKGFKALEWLANPENWEADND